MDNLLTLRPWLTVRETAKMLSRELEHEINESDIFSYLIMSLSQPSSRPEPVALYA
jgi:hypothetical protein